MNFLLPYTKSRTIKEQIKYETPAVDEHKPSISSSSSSTKVAKLGSSSGTTTTTTTTYTISTDESDENQYVTLIQSSTGELTPANGLEETHLQVEEAADTDHKAINPEQSFGSANRVVSPKEHLQEIIYEPLPAKRIKVSQEMDDADLDFFRSLLPDIRLMTASQKRRFKMGIFGLIDNVLSNNDINTWRTNQTKQIKNTFFSKFVSFIFLCQCIKYYNLLSIHSAYVNSIIAFFLLTAQ